MAMFLTVLFVVLAIVPINWGVWGNYGDFMGGIMAGLSALFAFMAWRGQSEENEILRKENRKRDVERVFFEMVRVHRENVEGKIDFIIDKVVEKN